MSNNAHASRVAEQLAIAESDDDEPRLIEAPITIHLSNEGLFLWIDEDAVGEGMADEIGDVAIEEIERRLFNRFPEVLLQNAEQNLTPEGRRLGEDAPRVATVEYYPDVQRIGGVAISMDHHAQWTMIPRSERGEE